MQQMRLNSTNLLLCSLQINSLLANIEASTGVVPGNDEDKDLEEDDG